VKRILLHFPDAQNSLFDPHARDNSGAPMILLRKRMADLGYELSILREQSVSGSEWVLFLDAISVYGPGAMQHLAQRISRHRSVLPERNVYRECIDAGLDQRIALFLLESPAIMPRNKDSRLHALFPIVFTWNDGLVDGQKFHKLRQVLPSHFPHPNPVPFSDKKLLVNISGNKHRKYPGELYSERRTSIRHFERTRPDDFDLYGIGWNKPSGVLQKLLRFKTPVYPSYRGTTTHKWDVYPHYRFGLCYENVRDEPGYVTEKIFDCLRADCVPIYWGAANVTASVPSDTFIDRRRFKSNDDLETYLVSMSETEYERYRTAIRYFLASDRFAPFLEDAFVEQVIGVLGLAKATTSVPA